MYLDYDMEGTNHLCMDADFTTLLEKLNSQYVYMVFVYFTPTCSAVHCSRECNQ